MQHTNKCVWDVPDEKTRPNQEKTREGGKEGKGRREGSGRSGRRGRKIVGSAGKNLDDAFTHTSRQ